MWLQVNNFRNGIARLGANLAFWLGVLLGGVVLGRLLGDFVLLQAAPAQIRTETASQHVEQLAKQDWFASGARANTPSPVSANLRLIGLITGRHGEQGVAVIERDGSSKPIVLRPGGAEEQGLQLVHIRPGAVDITEHGRPLTLALPASKNPITPSPKKD